MSGIYVHIPFCESRCVYCGFYSTTQLQLQDNYVDALIKELELRKNYLPSDDNNRRVIDTIYLGGGTPSLLSPKNLEKIFTNIYKVYNIDEDNLAQSSISAPTEITMECNPEDVTLDFVNNIKFLPIKQNKYGHTNFFR
jgi:oxygen-independent coproporphyrinogen-3 oxidase